METTDTKEKDTGYRLPKFGLYEDVRACDHCGEFYTINTKDIPDHVTFKCRECQENDEKYI